MTPTTDHILIEAIRTNPEDDLVRLAYADWLESEGDEAISDYVRGWVKSEERRYVRWSVNYNAWVCFDSEPNVLVRPIHCLYSSCSTMKWLTRFVPLDESVEICVYKGFVEKVWCDQTRWIKYSSYWYKYHPLRDVRIVGKSAQWSSTLPRCFFQEEKSKYHPSSYYASQDYPCIIHKDIYQYLGLYHGNKWNGTLHHRCYYDTQQQGNRDLSHACLSLAKEQLKDQQDGINKTAVTTTDSR